MRNKVVEHTDAVLGVQAGKYKKFPPQKTAWASGFPGVGKRALFVSIQ